MNSGLSYSLGFFATPRGVKADRFHAYFYTGYICLPQGNTMLAHHISRAASPRTPRSCYAADILSEFFFDKPVVTEYILLKDGGLLSKQKKRSFQTGSQDTQA